MQSVRHPMEDAGAFRQADPQVALTVLGILTVELKPAREKCIVNFGDSGRTLVASPAELEVSLHRAGKRHSVELVSA
jgi:hypothetical protein